jgi:hypothetical protein
LADRTAAKSSTEERLRAWLDSTGFAPDLPVDTVAPGETTAGRLVPEPGPLVSEVEDLSREQQAECRRAFGRATNLGLVRKYVSVRVNSLLRSAILHATEIDAKRVISELRFLAEIAGQSAA